MLSLLLALSSPSQAQSVQPIMNSVSNWVDAMEANNLLIGDMTLSLMTDDPNGASNTLYLKEGWEVVAVAVGDPDRVSDLDLHVRGPNGNVLFMDTEVGPDAVVRFEVPQSGVYDLRTVIAEGESIGYYGVALGYQLESQYDSVRTMFDIMTELVGLLESYGAFITYGRWAFIEEGYYWNDDFPVYDGLTECIAAATVDPNYVKRAKLKVYDDRGYVSDKSRVRWRQPVALAGVSAPYSGMWSMGLKPRRARYPMNYGAYVVGCFGE